MKGAKVVKEIQIKNFRSLKDTGLQKLSPITLLVGENSSGKSTFLRAFPLLKQSLSKRTSGPILWAGDVDDYVDFGSFEESVSNDGASSITLRFTFTVLGLGFLRKHTQFFIDDFSTSDDNYSEVDYEITIVSKDGHEYVSQFNITIDSTKVLFNLDGQTIGLDNGYTHKGNKNGESADLTTPPSREGYRYFSNIISSFGFVLPNTDELIETLLERIAAKKKEHYHPYRLVEMITEIGEALSKNRNLLQIDAKSGNNVELPSRYVRDYNKIISLLKSKDENISNIIKILYIYCVFPEIDEYIFDYFKQVHYIAPLRATAERYYRLRNLAIDEVDYQGKNLAIFINSLSSKKLCDFHAWTKKHFGFIVNTDKSKGHLSLLIKLNDSNKAINLSDTGFGYSQVLPIITQLWELSSHKKIQSSRYYGIEQSYPLVIAIEQPELHLHPAVQAKLAKAFIASLHLARENGYELQIILETHSQTIVNYLGRAISKGQLNKEDVSIILFEKNDNSPMTTVRTSQYNEEGYLENWPYGFFDAEE